MTDFENQEKIEIGGQSIRRPDNFSPIREDIIQAEYTTCTGKRIFDYVGWRFGDMTLSWQALSAWDVQKIAGLSFPAIMRFDAPDPDTGEPTQYRESVVRTSSVQALHPYKTGGDTYYRDVSIDIHFVDSHTD